MIWTIFSKIKASAYLYLGFAAIGLLWLLKYLVSQNATLKLEKKIEKKRADIAHSVMEKDKDIDIQSDVRLEELRDELKESGTSDELSDPNEDWK